MTVLTLPRAATPSIAALDLPRVQRNNPRRLLRSVRFNRADSAGFTRTPGSATNRKTWTFSTWVKLSRLGSQLATGRALFGANGGASNTLLLQIGIAADFRLFISGQSTNFKYTTARLNDHASWYHIVMAIDTNQAVANDRIKVYINGSLQTAFDLNTAPGLAADTGINNNVAHNLFDQLSGGGGAGQWDGQASETIFVDGRQVDISEFGFTDTNGVWQPKRYGGGIGGANGFILDFENGASTTTLGTSREGTVTWTPNNLSVAAGVLTNDHFIDGPSNVFAQFQATDTNGGGSLVRQGGLEYVPASGGADFCRSSISLPRTGKWYWEIAVQTSTGASVGVKRNSAVGRSTGSGALGSLTNELGYSSAGNRIIDGSSAGYLATYTAGDIIGILYDSDRGVINFHKNGVWGGELTYAWSIELTPCVSLVTGSIAVNFGQQPFAYPLQQAVGAKCLCTNMIPTPRRLIGKKNFDVLLYTGNGSTTDRAVQGTLFKPDLTIFKNRGAAANHVLSDHLRGLGQTLYTNTTAAQVSENEVVAQDERGLTVKTVGGIDRVNTNLANMLALCFRKGPHFDFRWVSHTNGASTTVGFEALGADVQFALVKRTDAVRSWSAYIEGLTAGNLVNLESSGAEGADTSFTVAGRIVTISSALPTGSYLVVVACSIDGICRVGKYTGNAASDGPFLNMGFRPRWIMTKARAGFAANWQYIDTARQLVNTGGMYRSLMNGTDTEAANRIVDLVSNGVKIRDTDSDFNGSAEYLYIAMAETPFKIGRAA